MMEEDKPVLVHCYIALKAGLTALWVKKKYSVPYVLTEQWTIHLAEAKPGINDLPVYFRNKLARILNNAAAVSVVSEYLGQRLKSLYKIDGYTLIPNVVNGGIFKPREQPIDNKLRLIHISGLDYQKNPEDILRALAIVNKTYPDFVLNVVGPQKDELKELVVKLGLSGKVEFLQEMLHPELVEHLRTSDALILYSRYETFGCVIIEAQACGIPVFVSDIPVLRENIIENFNGIIAEAENPGDLAARILEFIGERQKYSKNEISKYALEHYSYQKIGKMFHSWYLSCLKG
jgi:glycosyltransferase involved in cell wall biosynthesis